MAKEKDVKKDGGGHHYDASAISVLEGLEPVRRRPGMYIGTTGPEGMHHLVWEIFDNSRDEAMGGFCDDIEIVMLPENRVRVADNGRGVPVDIHKKTKVSALETVMTTLHAGGKFGGEGYKVSGGLHGVGASVVNALSSYCRAEVHRDGGRYAQEYSRGKKKVAVKKLSASKLHGTIITFEPDTEIFSGIKFDWHTVVNHIRQQAYLVKKLKISIIDARGWDSGKGLNEEDVFYFRELDLELPSVSFYFEGGLISLVKYYNKFQKPVQNNIFYIEKELDGVGVEVALQYVDDIADRIFPFANNIYNPEGGTHVTGFKTALTRTLNTYSKKNEMMKEAEGGFTGEDVLEGLTAVISVKLREIQFEGQTKGKLGSMEAQGAVATVFGEGFANFLEENPDEAKAIISKSILALKARKAAKAAKDSVLRKGALEGMTLPGKLADCQSKDASESELFIVEGDSAGGCFSAETKVALVDGRDISFKELVSEHGMGKTNYCYTIVDDGSIGIQKILNPRKTKVNAEVVKIVLDNEEEIICTPDHLFMLRDGTYKDARNLKPDESLMPFRKQFSRLGKRITIKDYEDIRKKENNKNVLSYETFMGRFFDGNTTKLIEAVENYNHKIKAILPLTQKIDVYDIEVPGTHNFALASGVFVHNSAKQGRDRRTQAILPLRGKILNVERARIDKMLASKEVKSLVIALGTSIGDTFDVGKIRYHKIIIATDADVDGSHIRTLLLTLFYRYFRAIIDAGYIYIAQPPLYKIKRGKEISYAYTDDEKIKIIGKNADVSEIQPADAEALAGEEVEAESEAEVKAKSNKVHIQRFKGLGEMNPEELWETTMDPANRVLKRVDIADAEEANKIFDILMGSEVPPRKSFIQSNAKLAAIDI